MGNLVVLGTVKGAAEIVLIGNRGRHCGHDFYFVLINVQGIKVAMSCMSHTINARREIQLLGSESRQLIEKLCAPMKFKKSFISKCFFSERPRLERYQFYFPLWLLLGKELRTENTARRQLQM